MNVSVTHAVPKKIERKKVSMRQRAYDHLYDPVYTVSSEVDHVRSSHKSYATHDRLKRVPVFESMFSSLPHHPCYTVHLDPADPVPSFINRRWHGYTEQRREALQQLTGPLMPFSQYVPSNYILTLPNENFMRRKAEEQPFHSTVGIQTDYRESETQTDPYSPDYVVRPGTTPSELLQLAALTWGQGLPAGLAEVEMIQRARAKRALEATLPPLDDLSQLDKRRRMMEDMDAEEWAFREGEIEKLQEARLAVLRDLLKQRDESQKELTSERLSQIFSKLLEEKERKLDKINNDYLRSLRKLEKVRKNRRGRSEQSGGISSYSSFQSFASPTSRDMQNDRFKSRYLDTYEGLQELEARLSATVLQPQEVKPKPKVKTTKAAIKPPVTKTVKLVEKYKALREERIEEKRILRYLLRKQRPVPRPPTPEVEEPPKGEEETELAVIHLQKLLRGRRVQLEMFKGKQNHLELMHELRTVQALQSEEQELLKADKKHTLALKKQQEKLQHKTSQRFAYQAGGVSAELEQVFSTLSRELILLQEERRIHAFTLLAERDRRLRAAEESGRRQAEDRRRREEDEIFRQVVQVHQESLDLYLEDIILETLEETASQQAREEIHRLAKEVNDAAYAIEESLNDLQSEEIVSELVYSFLVPEIEKFNVRRRVHKKQFRHLKAARSIIQGTAEHSGFLPSHQGASQPTCPFERASERALEETIHHEEQEQEKDEEQQHTVTE